MQLSEGKQKRILLTAKGRMCLQQLHLCAVNMRSLNNTFDEQELCLKNSVFHFTSLCESEIVGKKYYANMKPLQERNQKICVVNLPPRKMKA